VVGWRKRRGQGRTKELEALAVGVKNNQCAYECIKISNETKLKLAPLPLISSHPCFMGSLHENSSFSLAFKTPFLVYLLRSIWIKSLLGGEGCEHTSWGQYTAEKIFLHRG
jgi:hypothetical protein